MGDGEDKRSNDINTGNARLDTLYVTVIADAVYVVCHLASTNVGPTLSRSRSQTKTNSRSSSPPFIFNINNSSTSKLLCIIQKGALPAPKSEASAVTDTTAAHTYAQTHTHSREPQTPPYGWQARATVTKHEPLEHASKATIAVERAQFCPPALAYSERVPRVDW